MARKACWAQVTPAAEDRGLTQAQMAEQLGISPSYLNLIEHNERPVTVPLLLKLGKAFDVDLQTLSEDDERKLASACARSSPTPLTARHPRPGIARPGRRRPHAAGRPRPLPRLSQRARGRAGLAELPGSV